MLIPEYKTLAGLIHKIGSFGTSDVRIRIEATNGDEVKEYELALCAAGYTRRSFRAFPSAEGYGRYENIACTYEGDGNNIYIFYDACERVTHITAEPSSPMPPDKAREYIPVCEPFVSQIAIAFGMCYAIRLSDGSFVIIDGGNKGHADEDRIYAFLKAHTPSDKPHVSLWIFTHPDCDHITVATDFINRYHAGVSVDAFAYQFPDPLSLELERLRESVAKNIRSLDCAIADCYPNATVYRTHTGEIYHLPGAEIDILWTPDNMYPYDFTSYNDFSVSFKVSFEGGKSALFFGDTVHHTSKRIADIWASRLKCDIMQVSHHGLIGGNISLYRYADPEVCLWPTPEHRFTGEGENHKFKWCLGEGGCDYNAFLRDESIRVRRHYTHKEDAIISAITLEEIK